MKFHPSLAGIPIALVIGIFIGKQAESSVKPQGPEPAAARESRTVRPSRADPFGGPSFSLSSMEDVRELYRKQRSTIASARLALSVESLSADQIPAIMEMVQEDHRKNPNVYDESRYALMSMLFERWALVDPSASLAFVHSSPLRSFRNHAAQVCFAGLAQADPARAVAELQKLPKGQMREEVAPQVVAVLGKTDPEAALDLLASEPSRTGSSDYYARQIIEKWAKSDPAAAAAKLASLPEEIGGSHAVSGLASAWAQSDPDAALAWANTLKGERKSAACVEIYTAISREDPAAAWERLKGEPGHLRGKLIGGVLGVIADEDPQKAMAMLKSLESPSERRIAAGQLIEQLAWGETRLAFDLVTQLDDPASRRQHLGNLMYYAAWGSGELLKEQSAKLTERERVDTARQVLSGLMRSDPAAARDYFLALPEAQRTTDSLRDMMQQYARKDAAAALAFATSLGNPQEQSAAVNGLFQTWGRDDPQAAADGWKKLPPGDGRLGALDSIASSWAQNDPAAARKWAESLSGSERVRALAAVLPAMARDDPGKAGVQLAALLNAPPDGMAKNLANSTSSLAGTWASDDPSAAASWAAALPDGQWRDDGVGAVSRSWSQYDAIAAAEWIGTLESGPSRDAAVKPLVDRVRQTDPATAFSWAATIGDPADRVSQLGETLKSWRGTDLEAARSALDSLDLAPDERMRLEKEIE